MYTLHTNHRGNVRLLDVDDFQSWAVTKLPDYSADAYLLDTMGITVTDKDKFNKSMGMMIMALGLIGEAAEASELIKKAFGHGHKHELTEEKHDKIDMEQGDGLFYHAALAHFRGRKLSDFFGYVRSKLDKRYEKGFSSEASHARVDVQ